MDDSKYLIKRDMEMVVLGVFKDLIATIGQRGYTISDVRLRSPQVAYGLAMLTSGRGVVRKEKLLTL